MNIVPMNRQYADEYLRWQYKEPYTFYNIPPEGIEETDHEIFDDPSIHYFSVLKDGRLFGIYSYVEIEDGLEIGLGICPEETGKGNGKRFVSECLEFGRNYFDYQGTFTLYVVEFNRRAIHLYKQLGFIETGGASRLSFGKSVTFIKMELGAT